MPTVKQIGQILEEEQALKMVAEAYGEVAGNKLKRIRGDIEQTRTFFVEISKVFSQVKSVAAKQGVNTKLKTRDAAEILITSNFRFYGALENDLIRFFMHSSQKSSDRFFIGKTAQDFFQNRNLKANDKFIKFKTDLPSYEELKQLTEGVKSHEKILVYYPRFQSVLIQKPTIADITQTPNPDNNRQGLNENINFIFEPELDKILDFFDYQITGVLIQQVFLEAELARTAARLISMDQAQQNADQLIKGHTTDLKLAERELSNVHLLETISAIFGFRKAAQND
jgi:ATP synthase F1 gamma subunit